MKRARAQQPNKALEPQDPAAGADPKPQRRAKQPRQPKGAKKPGAAAMTRGEGVAAAGAGAAVAASNAAAAASVASPAPETAPTVPDVCSSGGAGEAGSQHAVDCWDLADAGLGGGAWWTWGVDEEKLLGWFPFVEEDFRCLAGRSGADAEAAAFDDDIWRIHQIYEIPNYAAK